MVFAFEPERDLAGPRLILSIFYIAVLVSVLFMAGRQRFIDFDKASKLISERQTLFGFRLGNDRNVSMDRAQSAILQKFYLKKGSDRIRKTENLSTLLESRSVHYRLFLETEEERIKLDEGEDGEYLERLGTELADFLRLSFEREESDPTP